MLNTTLKLTALAGVVGIGFLFVIQAQREITQPVNQQQNRLNGTELTEPEKPAHEEMELAFSEGVVPIEQSEPVFEEEIPGNDPDQSLIRDNFDAALLAGQDSLGPEMSSEPNGEDRISAGGLDFSDSEKRILQAGLDKTETIGSPTFSPTKNSTVLPETESSETPRGLFDISPSDSSAAASQPEFDTLGADSREPLFASDAETPGDSIFSSAGKEAEIPGDPFPEFDGSFDAETPGDAVSMPKSDLSSETPGDFVSSSQGEFIGEIPGDLVPSSIGKFDAETPGDSVSTSKGEFHGEIPGDAFLSESISKSSKNDIFPFGTSDAVTSSEGDSPKDAHPIIESRDHSNPFVSSQSSEKNAGNTHKQNAGINHLKQAHPLIGDKDPPLISSNSDHTDQADSVNDFFPADAISTNGTNSSKHNDASSNASTAFPFSSRETPAFDPELNPVPTTNSQTAESDQAETFPETASSAVLPDREENSLTGQPVFSAGSREQDDSEVPRLLELGDSTSVVQSGSPNPFDVTPEAAPLTTNTNRPGDEAGNRDKPRPTEQPQLNIEKVAPPNAVLGEPMIYSIIVQNVGSIPVHQVKVVDRIPKGTELMGTIPQAELDGDRLIWKVGTFQPNEKRTILVRITPREVGQIGSVATVHFFSEVAADTNIKQPDLKLSVSGPSQVRLGEPVVYRFKVTNTGTKDAKQVVIRDILPDGLSHPGGKDLEYAVGTLRAGKSEEIELTLTAQRPGTITNRVLVTAEGGVKIEKSVSLKVVASSLLISRTGPKQANVDQQTTAINLVTNDSNLPLENITVTESIPRGMKFIAASSGGRFDPIARKVEWSIDRLGPKQSMELKVNLVPTVVGTQISVVQAVEPDGTKVEVSSQTKIHGSAALDIDVISLEQPMTVGEQHTLRIFARNRGSVAATNVQARFFVPDEMELVSAQGPTQYVLKGNQVVFSPVPEVKGGMQAIFNLTLKARQSGKARVRVDINADQFNRPLIRDESISILPAN